MHNKANQHKHFRFYIEFIINILKFPQWHSTLRIEIMAFSSLSDLLLSVTFISAIVIKQT